MGLPDVWPACDDVMRKLVCLRVACHTLRFGDRRMPDYRRNFVPGGTYFFTCVTHCRRPILTTDLGRRCLREAILDVKTNHPFEIVAIVLLPDHWHTIWSLPSGDARYPMRWTRIKEEFTRRWLASGGTELEQSPSRQKHRLRGIWQKRYWEHTVRDEDDLTNFTSGRFVGPAGRSDLHDPCLRIERS